MARNRVIYQSEALFSSKDATATIVGHHKQLERVQSANYSFNINRQDVNQYGQLAKMGSLILDAPTVSADFSYLATDGFNERLLGFYVRTGDAEDEGGFASGHLVEGSGRNLFISTVGEGNDALGTTLASTHDVIGIGNAYLSDYSLDLSVGSLPTVSVTFEGSNINVSAGNSISNPAVNQTDGSAVGSTVTLPAVTTGVSDEIALRPGDVTVDITSFDGVSLSDLTASADAIHVQSASLSLPLSRSPLERLGTKYAYARSVDYPVTASLSVNAIVNELEAGALNDLVTTDTEKTITLSLKGHAGDDALIYTLKGCTLNSESFSSSVGSNKSVDLTFTTQIGGPNDTTHGILVSGRNDTAGYA